LQVKKELNREHYNLIIENSKNRVKGIVPTSLNLKQALHRLNIKHSHNSFGKITNMLGHPSSSKEVEIWNYPDHVGFWELINTPSQTLNYFPLGGETILIKWITVKDIRENVFRKEIEIIELNSPVINLQWADAIRLEVHDISLNLKVARQAQERITANQTYFISRSSRERDWLEKEKGRCSINRYKSQWESKPIKDPLLAVKTKDLVIGKSHLVASDNRIKKIDLGLVTPSIVIKEGHTNINCKRDAKVSAGGSVRFGLKSKLHTPRYSGSAKIIKYYSY
ncbi:MAG: hypothetical protein KC478_08895, partial [Bacteriovoracaceae bacterium]|nr:hypothetical protein [Bacteriovoracaceae bacterium]